MVTEEEMGYTATWIFNNMGKATETEIRADLNVRKRFWQRKPMKHGVALTASLSDTTILRMAASRRTSSARQSLNPHIKPHPIVVLMHITEME